MITKEKNIKAVLFDMDGVVVNSMPYHATSWVKIFSDYGIQIKENDIFLKEGIKPAQLIEETFTDNNKKIDAAKVEEVLDSKMKHFWGLYSPELFSGIVPCLKDLQDKGYKLAIVSGSTKISVDNVLTNFNLAKYFDCIIHSDLVTRGKPHPMSFQKATELLNLSPEYCVCIENAPYGIRSAKSAGIFTVAITTTLDEDALYQAGADKVVKTHEEITHLFGKIK